MSGDIGAVSTDGLECEGVERKENTECLRNKKKFSEIWTLVWYVITLLWCRKNKWSNYLTNGRSYGWNRKVSI